MLARLHKNTFVCSWWEYDFCRILIEGYLTLSTKVSNAYPIDPAILLLGIYTLYIEIQNELSSKILPAAWLQWRKFGDNLIVHQQETD